jgi:2,5-diketo-D-gluconate reductase A
MLRWCVQHGTVPLPKTTHKERMIENLDIFDFELTAKQMEKLDGLSTGKSVL